jgi:glutamate synthase domain-containing protein 3
MLKSDEELVQISQLTLEDIRTRATELLEKLSSETETPQFKKLFEFYEQARRKR